MYGRCEALVISTVASLLLFFSARAVLTNVQFGAKKISQLGIGTWAWGDRFYWQYNEAEDGELLKVYEHCLQQGVNFFDTAEVYGLGKSELLLARFNRVKPDLNAVVGTKFAPLPWRLTADSVVAACRDSMDRLGTDKIDLYQLHWPGLLFNEAYWDGIAQCYQRGWIGAVGVSNYGPRMLRQVYQSLATRNVPLASNQVQFSLLCRSAESNGLLQTAKDLNVTILAYSPLAQGVLTGKFGPSNVPKGPRSAIVRATVTQAQPLLDLMKDMAKSKSESLNLEVTPSQIALNWCIAKGTVPIPGARNLRQATDNCNALKWSLDASEVDSLDKAAMRTGINIATPLQRE